MDTALDPAASEQIMRKPRIGISACLLGREVRHDGGHKRSGFVCDVLGRFVEWVPVCPEADSGLSIPRESMRLVGSLDRRRLVGNRTGTDFTDGLQCWVAPKLEELATRDLDGFILKKGSPSCGLERVPTYTEPKGGSSRPGSGLFAAALRDRLPWLAVSEEGWLEDAALRDVFLSRVFTHRRLRTALADGAGRGALVETHGAHKLLYMAHSPLLARRLGQMVAAASTVARPGLSAVFDDYRAVAMQALGLRATRGKHANVLQHIVGYFKKVLTAPEKQEVSALIHEFRGGLYPLDAPLTLLVHHLRKHETSPWLAGQHYFEPYPRAISAAQ